MEDPVTPPLARSADRAPTAISRIECLDGLRGLAALWVLVGHCMLLTGFRLPLLGEPDLGVDLFILLSGFLMVYQYRIRAQFEDWAQPATWVAFWVRRFFRLAPLYYVLLFAALLLGSSLYADRVLIDTFLGRQPQLAIRYTDASAANVATHLSFVFGLLPTYAFRTPLPDWSLGLEMQFYAVFPLLVFLTRRAGWAKMTLIAAAGGILVAATAKTASIDFPMPSFLPLKLHLFLCGMLIAADLGRDRKRLMARVLGVLFLAAVPIGGQQDVKHLIVREAIALGFFALIHLRVIGIVSRGSTILGSRPFHWLGELSFGIYLVHLMVLQIVAAWAIGYFGDAISAPMRFGIVLGIVAPIGYGIALATYFAIERPGQVMGRHVLARFVKGRRQARQVAAEEIAAP
jgi:peptidoglycan/LPS O-acetylase OafA/YrhL